MWDSVTLVGILFRFAHNIPHSSDPRLLRPEGPYSNRSNPTSSRNSNGRNAYAFVACRFRAMLYDVRTSFMNERVWVGFPGYSNV